MTNLENWSIFCRRFRYVVEMTDRTGHWRIIWGCGSRLQTILGADRHAKQIYQSTKGRRRVMIRVVDVQHRARTSWRHPYTLATWINGRPAQGMAFPKWRR